MPSRVSLRSLGMVTLLWVVPGFAHAQAGGSMQEGIALMVTWAIAVMNLGIWIVFSLLTQLLDTSQFLDANMTKILNEIWQLSRDLVNIAFAAILIGAAVYTVVTSNREFIANNLKKFVLAVVLVNFSWFIPRVIIDIGNIAAATVFDIPSLLAPNGNVTCTYRSSTRVNMVGVPPNQACKVDPVNPRKFICRCAALVNAAYFQTDAEAALLLPADGWTPVLANTLYVQLADLDSIGKSAPVSAVLNGLIINHARLMGLASVPPSAQTTEVKALIMFLLQQAIVLLLHVALFFPLAAMLLAFAIRIPVLWLTIAFMPFMVLQYVLPEQYITEYPKKLMENFISAVFLPAKVGIPLTIGFIMVNAGQKLGLLQPLSGVSFKLTNNISDFWQLLWLVMTLGIIWEGVFEALSKAGVMGKFSESIKGAGQGLGMMALKTPLSIPFIPLRGGNGNEKTSLLNIGRTVKNLGQFDNPEQAMENLRGKNSEPASIKMKEKAKELATNNAALRSLDVDVKDLTRAMAAFRANPNQAGNKQAVDALNIKISQSTGINPSDVNSAKIESFIREARAIPGAQTSELNTLSNSNQDLKTEEKK